MDELQKILDEMGELGFMFWSQWTHKKHFKVIFREVHRPRWDHIAQHGISDNFMDAVKEARDRTLLFVSKVADELGPDWHNRPFNMNPNARKERAEKEKAKKATLAQ